MMKPISILIFIALFSLSSASQAGFFDKLVELSENLDSVNEALEGVQEQAHEIEHAAKGQSSHESEDDDDNNRVAKSGHDD